MIKSTILVAFLLGMVFAQMIPASPLNSDSEADDSDGDSNDRDVRESESSETDDEESKYESPALTCLLFENLGCNTECSTIASAFSLEGTGECTEKNICECSIDQDESLEGLFREKFDAEDALEKIKNDTDLSAKVLEILQIPFQTIVQTKRQLKDVVSPAIYNQLIINDKTPAWKLGLIDEIDNPNRNKIKSYVSKKLKPVLKSSSKQLKNVEYTSIMKKSLEGKSNEDLQSIVNEVRRTKNKNLNEIVKDYLKSTKINVKSNTDKDDIADAIGHEIINQFVNHIKKNENQKPARKTSTKNVKKSRPAEKNSIDRFELHGFDKEFLKHYGDSFSESFIEDDYKVVYSKDSDGSIRFTWTKGVDEVRMSIAEDGSIDQVWHLDDAVITLGLSCYGSRSGWWNFGKIEKGNCADEKKHQELVKKYQNLIDEWCDKNYFLLPDKKQCFIY